MAGFRFSVANQAVKRKNLSAINFIKTNFKRKECINYVYEDNHFKCVNSSSLCESGLIIIMLTKQCIIIQMNGDFKSAKYKVCVSLQNAKC